MTRARRAGRRPHGRHNALAQAGTLCPRGNVQRSRPRHSGGPLSGREVASGTPSGRRLASAPAASARPEPARNSHGRRRSPPPPLCLQLLRRVLHDYSLRPTSPNACDCCGANSPAHSVLFHLSPFCSIPSHSPPPLPAPREKPRPPAPQWRQQSGSCCRSDLRHFRCASGGLARPGPA